MSIVINKHLFKILKTNGNLLFKKRIKVDILKQRKLFKDSLCSRGIRLTTLPVLTLQMTEYTIPNYPILCNRINFFKVLSGVYNQKYFLTTSVESSHKTTINYVNGLVTLTIPLIAKNEKCLFTLKPLNDTVGSFIEYLKIEDKAIEKANIYTLDGLKLSCNTQIGNLVREPFKLQINDTFYVFQTPANNDVKPLDECTNQNVDEIKTLVTKLYIALNMDENKKIEKEKIIKEIEALKVELEPMEKVKEELALKSKKHTNRMIWVGLGAMCVQAGILARLTWFEYSWDIVEPISYFVTYAAVIGVYSYFVLTRKEYDYESASDRIFLRHFHKNALKSKLDIEKYNHLKETIYKLEKNLTRVNGENQLQKN